MPPQNLTSDLLSSTVAPTRIVQQMRNLAGPGATVYFANLSLSSAAALRTDLESSEPGASSQAAYVATHVGVKGLMEAQKMPIGKICLLDPKAEKELSPEDGDGEFDWFLFGVSSETPCV